MNGPFFNDYMIVSSFPFPLRIIFFFVDENQHWIENAQI